MPNTISKIFIILSVLVPLSSTAQILSNLDASQIFTKFQDSVFQIRVVELASGNKTAIGSGFAINKQGHIATNYHVVSHFVLHPERYRLEYISRNGESIALRVVDIDVVHDLAIAKADTIFDVYLELSTTELPKGAPLFSLGNPHDLGMSIVEGTYNGILDNAFYDKIFFSGSLNPGMSGGPTLNEKGSVIGVNVSTAGNQLSFLVPSSYLSNLINNANKNPAENKDEFISRIEQQLLDNQARNINNLLNKDWITMHFDQALLPGEISPVFKCWGDSENNKESYLDHSYSHCMSEDKIFLANYLTTGAIAYSADLYTGKDLSSLHFYNLYSKQFGRSMQINSAKKEDVTNYRCQTDSTFIAEQEWKSAICARNYRLYPQLWDVVFETALISEYHKGMIIKIALAGVTKEMALKFIKRFIEEIRWQPS